MINILSNKWFKTFLLFCLIISLSIILFKPLWPEPDSTAFYNRACLGGADFQTPILSRVIFSLLPCNIIVYKLFNLFLILAAISAFYYFNKKNLKTPNLFFLAFLSYFVMGFILQLEDDQIAFPLIVAMTGWLLSNPTWKKRIMYGLGILFLVLFIWSGAFVPGILFLAYTIEPTLSLIAILAYIVYHYLTSGTIFFNEPGLTAELQPGYGFISDNILLLVLFFLPNKIKQLKDNKNLFVLFMATNVLTLFYPKFGYYGIIPILLLFDKVLTDYWKQLLIIGGIIALVLAPTIILWNSQPNQKMWNIIDHAVALQESGQPVYNEWWVGRWFYYAGGHPSQEGGNEGPQHPKDKLFYWLGQHRKECNLIESTGLLVLDKCIQP